MTEEKTIDEMDYDSVDNITCPYCGWKDEGSWEVRRDKFDGDLGVQECEKCEKQFTASRYVSVSYTSSPAPCLNSAADHDWKQMIGAPKEYFEGRKRCRVCSEEKREKVVE